MKSEQVYVSQILDAINKIEKFTAGMPFEQFADDQKTQSAVILQLLLIGEVSKKISAGTKSAVALPWKEIAGFRDKAIHDYFDIDLEIVWRTISDDLPPLKQELHKLKA